MARQRPEMSFMKQLVLVRHGESEWNKKNLFTGWTDVDLSEKGWEEARSAGAMMRDEGFVFDRCYTSYLRRAIHTAHAALGEMDLEWIEEVKDWRLNERHYGALQGLNKSETAEKYGRSRSSSGGVPTTSVLRRCPRRTPAIRGRRRGTRAHLPRDVP